MTIPSGRRLEYDLKRKQVITVISFIKYHRRTIPLSFILNSFKCAYRMSRIGCYEKDVCFSFIMPFQMSTMRMVFVIRILLRFDYRLPLLVPR